MKNIAKIIITIIAFTLTLSSNSLAQNEKKQVVKDSKKISIQDLQNNEKNAEINGKFYFGMEAFLQNYKLSGGYGAKEVYDYYEPNTTAVAVFFGYDNEDFFKIESFYSKSNEKNQVIGNNGFSDFELRARNFGVDFKPYINFDKNARGLLYAIFGLNYNHIEATENLQSKTFGIGGVKNEIISKNASLNKFSPSLGLGVEYLCYKNFSCRFQHKRNFINAEIDNMTALRKVKVADITAIGISYSF